VRAIGPNSVPADICFNTALQSCLDARELYRGESPGLVAIRMLILFFNRYFFLLSGTTTKCKKEETRNKNASSHKVRFKCASAKAVQMEIERLWRKRFVQQMGFKSGVNDCGSDR